MTLSEYLAEVEARRLRCADALDVGGTEQALIGGDIDALLVMLRRAVEGLDAPQRREDEANVLLSEAQREIERHTREHADCTGHLHTCAKVNGVWACTESCAVKRAERAEAQVQALQRGIEAAEQEVRKLRTREVDTLKAAAEVHDEFEAQVQALREWKHICVAEACCIENAFHALAPRTEKGDTYSDGSPRCQDDPTPRAKEEKA